eukprot:COSAG01_NODE_4461_length_5002_cov_2.196410_2_plen_260_part_00
MLRALLTASSTPHPTRDPGNRTPARAIALWLGCCGAAKNPRASSAYQNGPPEQATVQCWAERTMRSHTFDSFCLLRYMYCRLLPCCLVFIARLISLSLSWQSDWLGLRWLASGLRPPPSSGLLAAAYCRAAAFRGLGAMAAHIARPTYGRIGQIYRHLSPRGARQHRSRRGAASSAHAAAASPSSAQAAATAGGVAAMPVSADDAAALGYDVVRREFIPEMAQSDVTLFRHRATGVSAGGCRPCAVHLSPPLSLWHPHV